MEFVPVDTVDQVLDAVLEPVQSLSKRRDGSRRGARRRRQPRERVAARER